MLCFLLLPESSSFFLPLGADTDQPGVSLRRGSIHPEEPGMSSEGVT